MIVQQLICDVCNKVLLEKQGQTDLHQGKFPISDQEATEIDREHRGHQCHIDVVEKE
jgi:phage FluMu protein Com